MAAETSTAASAGRSGGGGASADSYIGSLISLTSKSEIRYEGILYNINTEESSIGLRNVRSFGTEGRKKDGPQVPPSDKIYEYILFRGTDIKDLALPFFLLRAFPISSQVVKIVSAPDLDLQVKASPPVQTTPPINSDPAIIQSHYPRPTNPPTGLATVPTGSFADIGSHSAQMGLPGSTFQSGLPLYQPAGNMNSWVPSPPNTNGSGLPMPMYWQGYYGTPNGLPQLPQQTLLRPPLGLSIAPSMQQMQFSALNSTLPTATSSLSGSSLPDNHSSFVPNSTSSSNLTSTSLPASTLSLNVPPPGPPQPVSLASEIMTNLLPNKAPPSAIPTSAPSSGLPSLAPFSVDDNVGTTSFTGKSIVPGSAALLQQNIIQPVTSVAGTSGSGLTETQIPSLITPGQLLQSGPSTASTPQPLQTTQKDVEVVQVSPKLLSGPSAPMVMEAQPPILPLPPNARAHKPNGGSSHMRNNYRGRGGRGFGNQRPVTKFTEDFDFMAMNEKFKKDEVWGHLGKSNRSQSNKEGNGSGSDEEDREDEDDVELPKIDIQPVYNKDDFFDSLSCNATDNDPNRGRPKYSEQMKLDTETFGEFSRYRGGRGGRGPGRGGGRFRGSSYGRGYGGYGYVNRGRGRGLQSRAS